MTPGSKRANKPLYQICIKCGRTEDLVVHTRQDGSRFMLCRDLIACGRRRMAMAEITLLPHPKNPETAQ